MPMHNPLVCYSVKLFLCNSILTVPVELPLMNDLKLEERSHKKD